MPLLDVSAGVELLFGDLLWGGGASYTYLAETPLAAGTRREVFLAPPDAPRAEPTTTALVFIDSRVTDLQALVDAAQPGTQVWVLSPDFDGVQQIADLIQATGTQGLASIHLVSHGTQGAVQLGSTLLDAGDMDAYAAQLAQIGAALGPDGDLLLYGCDVGAGDSGLQFITDLAAATGADVAASTDATGGSALQADWALEVHTGPIEAQAPFDSAGLDQYDGVLATPLTATQSTVLAIDVDGDGQIDPGDRVTTTVTLTTTTDALGVYFNETLAGMTLFDQPGNDINVSPIAINDSYTAVGNTLLEVGNATAQTGPQASVAGHVTDNDIEFFGDTFEITSFTATSAQGGTVNMVTSGADRGSFTYISAPNYTGADTFTYTIRDKGLDGIADNADDLTSTATVTITVANQVWYVDSSVAVSGNGTSTNPFKSLADVSGAAGLDDAGDTIYLSAGSGSYTGGITLLNNQTLHGANEALVVGGVTLAAAGTDPVITNASGNGVTLASGNTLKGFTVDDTSGFDIANTGSATVGTLNISNVILSGTGGLFRADSGGALNVTFDSASTTNATSGGLLLSGVGGSFTVAGATSISGVTGDALDVIGNSSANVSFQGLTLGSGSGISGKGIVLTGHTGTFSATSGSIAATTDNDVEITNGAGAVTLPLNITNTAGRSVLIDNHETGNITFSGTINDTGTGVLVQNMNSGTVLFSGSAKTLNTGANTAVNLQSNTGGTINFTGGALDIDTTTGAGFTATGGGTVTVQGTGNSITSGAGTALNIANTTIGSADVTFQSISAGTGTTAGIIVDNTGGLGGLHVTGNGATAGAGGTIASRSGADITTIPGDGSLTITGSGGTGIFLRSTSEVQLNGLNLHDFSNFAILGSNVNGLTLSNSTINGVNGNSSADSAVWFQQLLGTASVNNTTISGGYTHNMALVNSSGTLNSLTISNGTISNNNALVGSNGLHIINQGSAVSTVVVDNVSFANNRASGVLADESGTGSLNLTVTNSDFSDGTTAVNLGYSLGGTGGYQFNVTNNTMVRHANNVINIATGDQTTNAANIRGTIANNTIGNGALDSGSADTYGIAVDTRGDTNMVLAVTGNTVSNTDWSGIFIQARLDNDGDGETAHMDLTVRNNTVNTPDDNSASPLTAVYGMLIESRNTATVRLDLAGNNSSSVGVLEEIRLRQRDTASFQLERLTDGDGTLNELITNLATVEARILTDNPAITTADATAVTGFYELADLTVPNPLLAAPGGTTAAETLPSIQDAPVTQPGDTVAPASDDQPATPPPEAFMGPQQPVVVDDGVLSQAELDTIVAEAIARWQASGLSPEQLAYLQNVSFTVSDLAGLYLGSATPGQIVIDANAAGYGWFIDSTPADDAEFTQAASSTRLLTDPSLAPAGRIDLLTAVMHELGHQLGLEDSYANAQRDDLEYGYLVTGERRLPSQGQAEGATVGSVAHEAFFAAPVEVSYLPTNRTVTIQWQATIDAQTNQLIVNPSNQGSVAALAPTPINASTNTVVTTLDALTLGGTIWADDGSGGGTSGNGLLDGTEAGVDGVLLSLLVDANDDNIPDSETPIATTTTSGGGNYSFTGLAPGNYIVRVDQDNFDAGGNTSLVTRHRSSPDVVDPDDNVDNDNNGSRVAGQPAYTQAITLDYNTEPTAGVGNDTNTTLDLGFIPNAAPTMANTIANQDATEDSAFSFSFAANTVADTDADPGDTLTYTATLASDAALPAWLSFTPATRSFSGTPLNANVGTISVKVTANDGRGGSVSETFDITVANTNDTPTVANAIPDQSVNEDSALSFTFAANAFADVDVGDTLTYAATLANDAALPAWLSFNAATRTFSGTPVNADVGAIDIKVSATDVLLASVSDTFSLTVVNTNDAPTVANLIADQDALEASPFSFVFAIDTFADVDVGDSLTYTATKGDGTPLPAWLSFDGATRTFSGTPALADVGTLSVKVTANDGHSGTVSDIFDITVDPANAAPTVVFPIADQSATEDSAFSLTFPANTFADADAGDTLTYTATQGDGNPLPAWLSFDAATRTFSGTPLDAAVGTLSVKLTADDSHGGTVSDTFDITVANINDLPRGNVYVTGATDGIDRWLTADTNLLSDDDGLGTLHYTWLRAGVAIVGAPDAATYPLTLADDNTLISVRVTYTDQHGTAETVTSYAVDPLAAVLPPGLFPIPGTTGNDGLDASQAEGGDVFMTGYEGLDTLLGGTGDDWLDGGRGADSLVGGAGNDTYIVDNVLDKAIENGGEGTDTVVSYVSYTLGANIENLILVGTAAINGTGNSLNNQLTGNNVVNLLRGGAGNDTLDGAGGNDILYGEADQDVLFGGAGNDQLDGGLGNDSLNGGIGLDNLIGGDGNDSVWGEAGNDTLTGGNGNDQLDGGLDADRLDGGAGNDRLLGSDGADTLYGGLGQDTLDGGAGNDLIVFNTTPGAGNVDMITNFNTADDTIQLVRYWSFAALPGTGTLAATAFWTGAAAHDADDRIVYDITTGALYYDADGTGATAAIQFATLVGVNGTLTTADFAVV